MKTQGFEEYLEAMFMEAREIGGVPITKDNYENLYDSWLQKLDIEDWILLGDSFKNHE